MADFGIGELFAATAATTAAEAGTAAAVAAPAVAGAGLEAATAASIADVAAGGVGLADVGGGVAGAGLSSYIPSLSTIGEIGSVAGTGIQAISGMRNAEYQAAVARAQAAGLKQKADEEAAVGEQAAIQRQRQSEYVQSKYRAGMATSGTTPVGEDTTLSDIAGQGQYNTLSSLYQGLTSAASSRRQADIDLFGAQNVESAAPIAAAGTVLAGLSSFADKRARMKFFTTSGETPSTGF